MYVSQLLFFVLFLVYCVFDTRGGDQYWIPVVAILSRMKMNGFVPIHLSPFSFCTFLYGNYYLLYRRQYFYFLQPNCVWIYYWYFYHRNNSPSAHFSHIISHSVAFTKQVAIEIELSQGKDERIS